MRDMAWGSRTWGGGGGGRGREGVDEGGREKEKRGSQQSALGRGKGGQILLAAKGVVWGVWGVDHSWDSSY